LKAPETT